MRPRSRGSSEGLLHSVPALPSHFQVAQWTNPNHYQQVSRWAGQERQRRWGFWIFTAGSRFQGGLLAVV